ncbi:PilZ domain-containing protein [Bradyrhizobium jicamae]|uniref:PilZ domain-containing protein n=1 Tax=Bradyrhizobium jicamae TaxID=280332 RepID=UPI001BAC9527|nr:PilZ domain-containing protein [Bradyrhizobium jicamae]MBR0935419.1 PilZ domain-containing protein [Bradyrhizobium jicamae]
MHPRRFARVRPTGCVSSSVKLLLEPKAPMLECRLVDYSAGGACIELPKLIKLPERFEMLHGNIRKRCRRVWARGVRVGVTF